MFLHLLVNLNNATLNSYKIYKKFMKFETAQPAQTGPSWPKSHILFYKKEPTGGL